eukprot:1016704-Rhodomonas_salina.1
MVYPQKQAGTLESLPGVNWIAAFHCAAAGPDPSLVAACTMDRCSMMRMTMRIRMMTRRRKIVIVAMMM